MTDQNLKNDTNLTTNHQSDEATADKALFIDWDTLSADVDNYSAFVAGKVSKG